MGKKYTAKDLQKANTRYQLLRFTQARRKSTPAVHKPKEQIKNPEVVKIGDE